jgi:hypothetical protein
MESLFAELFMIDFFQKSLNLLFERPPPKALHYPYLWRSCEYWLPKAPLIKQAVSEASGGFTARRFKPWIPRSPFGKGRELDNDMGNG